ncbi:MAG: HNH endonuclease [Clostridiales bacterium]|jgi:CRISPR/Cas system Type II protein with McrA/HNH and RuvC-like nuclease domain|nr:HNH endonuclease [Clostridiales bacterium]
MSNEIYLWEKDFGNKQIAYDFAGREIHKSEYGNENSPYGWNIDHIQPLSNGGKDTYENIQIANIATNREKDNKSSFSANGKKFQVQLTKNAKEKGRLTFAGGYPYNQKKYCIVEIKK